MQLQRKSIQARTSKGLPMEAAAERLEQRKASFKAGPDGTRKRDEAQSIIRKDKRNKLLEKRRGPSSSSNGGDVNILAGLGQFNRQALLAGNPQQLILLAQILQHATQTQAEEHWPTLLLAQSFVVLRFLVSQCFVNELAARALVHATGHITSHDVSMARVIVDAGFLTGMTNPQRLSSTHHAQLWELMVNVALSCPEGAQLIMQHCGNLDSQFLNALRQATSTHDPVLESATIHLAHILISKFAAVKGPEHLQ